MAVRIGDTWKVFDCPECEEELFVVDSNAFTSEIEVECQNGHAWIISTAFGE